MRSRPSFPGRGWGHYSVIALALAVACVATASIAADADSTLKLRLRSRVEPTEKGAPYLVVEKAATWSPEQTAVIVCDMWDLHHCLNAVRRGTEMAPTMDKVLSALRDRGVLVIHAPSGCMDPYKDHPGRKLAKETPKSKHLPKDIGQWCYKIPAEEKGAYPIDQTDGGEDDDPAEHKEWAAKLSGMGRNPRAPWKSQMDLLTIKDNDVISDDGEEIWSVLEARGIDNVILMGVHLNMCVLGRPFGLRQMSKNGKNVVLMRDMTDTMYNPAMPPRVNHFTGTDLMVEHVEKFVGPTITSDQVLGGVPFRFKDDKRPHVAFVIAEDEYKTEQTLPAFATSSLIKDKHVDYVFDSEGDRNDVPGIGVLDVADAAVISVRR
ncbi:cysteine hydrolase family protein, partial [Singulisphaera rosea]